MRVKRSDRQKAERRRSRREARGWKRARLRSRLYRLLSPSVAAALGVLVVTAVALFVPPYVGMADNGDYFRILYGNGLYFNAPDYDGQYFGYFVRQYGILQYYNEYADSIFSSQTLLIKLSLWVNELLYSHRVFDIRFQGAILTVLYAAAIYLLVEALTWKAPAKYGYPIAGIAVFLFADTGYTAYFNSFYGESVVLIAMLFLLASGLLLYRRRFNDYAMLALFFASALLLTTSKQQNAPVGVIVAALGVFLLPVRRSGGYRAGVASMLAALLGAGVAAYALIPQEFVDINKYHAMTRGVLMGSSDPEATLKSFGIDKQYAILNGSTYYDLYTPIDVNSPLLEKEFYSKYGFFSILAYYAEHPGQAYAMLDLAAQGAFDIRPQAMGNYELSAGKPFGAQTRFFSAYSWLKSLAAPKTFGFIVLWAIVVIGLYVPSFLSAIRKRRWRQALRLPVVMTLMAMGLSNIVILIVGAGDADLSKHEFMFTASFDMIVFVLVSDAIRRQLWKAEPEEDREDDRTEARAVRAARETAIVGPEPNRLAGR